MSKVVYYDITRLLHRSRADSPTGIDRVDINYANHFLHSEAYSIQCIFQEKNVFFLVDGSSFIEALYKKWIESIPTDFDFAKFFSGCVSKKKVNSKLLTKQKITSVKSIDNIDGVLLDSLVKTSADKGIYINTSHHGIGNSQAYQVFKLIGNLRIVFYLHDIIPIDFPEYVREGDEITHAKRVTAMAQYGDCVLVNSEYTQNRFTKFCETENLRIPETHVLYIGVEQQFLDLLKKQNEQFFKDNSIKYFVYISTIEPRKNHIMLLHIWRQMVIEERNDIPKLVILGKRGWNNQNILDLLDRSVFLRNHIIELSNLSDAQMLSVLKGARALLYPSFVEGWGMPIVEGVAVGIPVVCSDIAAHRESGQNLVKYISVDDSLSWKNTILELSTSDELYTSIVSNYVHYQYPLWSVHFQKLDPILENISLNNFTGLLEKSHTISKDVLLNYCAHVDRENSSDANDVTVSEGFLMNAILSLFFGKDKSKRQRLIRKFSNNPVTFFMDSKNPFFKKLGYYLNAMK